MYESVTGGILTTTKLHQQFFHCKNKGNVEGFGKWLHFFLIGGLDYSKYIIHEGLTFQEGVVFGKGLTIQTIQPLS